MSVEKAQTYLNQAQSLIAQALGELSTPPSDMIIDLNAGGDLQTAIDNAKPDSTIRLEAGATWQGPFNLKGRGITLTSRTVVPPAGQRVTVEQAASFAKIRASKSESAILHKDAINLWTLVGLEVIGDPTSNASTIALDPQAVGTLLDRMYIHGDAAGGAKRGVGLNAQATGIRNCCITDFKRSGQDTQAVGGSQGPGPYVIENCLLEASGENVLFGGSDPTTPNLIPSDIVIRGNTIRKPFEWQSLSWSVKNLLELKNAQRVLIEQNIFEGCWVSGQVGYALLLTVRNQDGNAPWCTVSDVTIRNNVVRSAAAFLQVLGLDDTHPSVRMNNIKVLNNLGYDLDPKKWASKTGVKGSDKTILFNNGPQNFEVGNNTLLHTNHGSFLALTGSVSPKALLNIHHNVLDEGNYGIVADAMAPGQPSWDAFADGTFSGNLIQKGVSGRNLKYPGTNRISAAGQQVTSSNFALLPEFADTLAGVDLSKLPVG
jgi:hypothetical protein